MMTTTPQEPGQNPDVPHDPDVDPTADPGSEPDLTSGGDPEANANDPKPGSGTLEEPR